MHFSSSYLLPAILLNPSFILHLINTLISFILPSTPIISHSPHPIMESLGPLPGTSPFWDMHADDALCWKYTMVMVLVQLVAFGRVADNRDRRRARRLMEKERESGRSEEIDSAKEGVGQKFGSVKFNGGLDGVADSVEEGGELHPRLRVLEAENDHVESTGSAYLTDDFPEKTTQAEVLEVESEASLMDTSEEEMVI